MADFGSSSTNACLNTSHSMSTRELLALGAMKKCVQCRALQPATLTACSICGGELVPIKPKKK